MCGRAPSTTHPKGASDAWKVSGPPRPITKPDLGICAPRLRPLYECPESRSLIGCGGAGAGRVEQAGAVDVMNAHGEGRRETRGWRAVLGWLARLRVAGIEPMAAGLGVSPRAVRTHARRLEAEALAKRPRLYDGGGGMLAITPRGLHRAGYEISSRTTTSSVSGLTHGRAVSWIAAHCARKERRWFGPAELRNDGWEVALPRRAGFQAKTRLPDLGLILEGRERWAVEFERVEMPGDRLQRILDGYRRAELAGQIDGVLYVCASERIARTVRSASSGCRLTTPCGRSIG